MYKIAYLLMLLLSASAYAESSKVKLETWEHRFTEKQVGAGLNTGFALSIGSHHSYAAKFYLNPFFEWDPKHNSLAWPLIKSGDNLRPLPKRYIKKINVYADKLLSTIDLHPRIMGYSFALPYIPHRLKARLTSNEGKHISSAITFPKVLLPIRPGWPAPRSIDFRKPEQVVASAPFKFFGFLTEIANGNYFGAKLISQCHSGLEKGAIKSLKITMKEHELYAPHGDELLVKTTLKQPVYSMSIINTLNLDRVLITPSETDKIELVATCTTTSGEKYIKEQEIIIKSLYKGNPGSGYYNKYNHVRVH